MSETIRAALAIWPAVAAPGAAKQALALDGEQSDPGPGESASLGATRLAMPFRPLWRQAGGVHPRDVTGHPPQPLAIGAEDQLVDEREAV